MAGQSGELLLAGIIVLTLAGTACGYERNSGPYDPGEGDTSGVSYIVGQSEFRVFTASGDIAATLAEFRAALGDPANGGTQGPLSGGRREIKWDGAPAEMPGDFFNTTVKAGAIFSTDGIGFRNSDGDFSEINPAYADDFNAFSLPKTFMPIGSAELTVTFRIPGLQTVAATRGFGVAAGALANTTHRSGAIRPGSPSSASPSRHRWWPGSRSRRANGPWAKTSRT
jgi:hypothetical protein